MDTFSTDLEHGYPVPERLETVCGPGFMSPGGPAEVARMLKVQSLAGVHVLDLGSGLGGAGHGRGRPGCAGRRRPS